MGTFIANSYNYGVVLASGDYLETGFEGFVGNQVGDVRHLY